MTALAGALPGRPRRVGGAGLAAGPPRQRKSGADIPPRLDQPPAPVTGFLCFTIGRKKAAELPAQTGGRAEFFDASLAHSAASIFGSAAA